jgi:single-stranded-DNA-specific exonuclease
MNENLASFQEAISQIAADKLDVDDLTPMIVADAEVNLADIDWALQGILEQLEPTGNANATPLLMSSNVHVYGHQAVGSEGAHLRFWVGDGRMKLPCIAFRQGAWANCLPDKIDLIYRLNVNEWNGRRDLQLVVEDIRPAEDGTGPDTEKE